MNSLIFADDAISEILRRLNSFNMKLAAQLFADDAISEILRRRLTTKIAVRRGKFADDAISEILRRMESGFSTQDVEISQTTRFQKS